MADGSPSPTEGSRLRPLTREEVRSIDAQVASEFGLPTVVLMENAGRGAAALLAERAGTSGRPRVLILCGPGNNGGDGGVVARHLDRWGYPVQVVWFAEPERLRGDAAIQWKVGAASGLDQSAWPPNDDPKNRADVLDALIGQADWLVDGLLGTGLTRPVEGLLRDVIEAINRSGKLVLALDLPSGLDADTGQPLGVAVQATLTVTFVAPKVGFEAAGARDYTGEVVILDIGAPRRLLERFRDPARL